MSPESHQYVSRFADLLWESFTLQSASILKAGCGGNIANEVLHSRGKMGYLFPMLKQKKRIQCFYSDLAIYGSEEDIEPLQNIVDDRLEPQIIRDNAQYAIDAIKARFP